MSCEHYTDWLYEAYSKLLSGSCSMERLKEEREEEDLIEGGSTFQIAEADGRNDDYIAVVREKGIKMFDG